MPVLNLAQDSVNILGHGELAQGGIGNRYRLWRNPVGELGPGCGLHGCVGFKGDFVAHIRELSAEFPVRRKRLYNWGAATGCRQHCGNLKRLLHKIGTNSKGVLPGGSLRVAIYTCGEYFRQLST